MGKAALYFDISGAYDPANNQFDHHQLDAPLREDGTPYSAFGLIWRHFGIQFLDEMNIHPDQIEEVFARIEQDFVLPIDLLDNGIVSPGESGRFPALALPSLISSINPTLEETGERREQMAFMQARDICLMLLQARVKQVDVKLRARHQTIEAINRTKGPILELPEGFSYQSAIRETGADHILFVMQPRKGDWTLSAVAKQEGSYERRLDLPEAWAGLEGAALAEVTGVADAVFCHRARFIAVARSKAGIQRLAGLAVPEIIQEEPIP